MTSTSCSSSQLQTAGDTRQESHLAVALKVHLLWGFLNKQPCGWMKKSINRSHNNICRSRAFDREKGLPSAGWGLMVCPPGNGRTVGE